jgi:hypothetical protein
MLDTTTPRKSLNLNAALGLSPTKLTLMNGDFNQYFVYNKVQKTLSTASLGSQKLKLLLKNVGDYATYSDDTVLYVQSQQDNDGKSQVMLYENGKSHPIRRVKSGDKYLLDLNHYGGDLYVLVAARSENEVYIYKNPVDLLDNHPDKALTAAVKLKIKHPDYEDFSPNSQYLVVENGNHFVARDLSYRKTYSYKSPEPLDKPQSHAEWMDDGLLDYVSGGQLVVFDFDGTNLQQLMAASPRYAAVFDGNHNYAYTLAPNTDKSVKAKMVLTQTPLLTKADL